MFEFKLPDLGEGVHEGEILKWHVDTGDQIEEDQPLVDVETDKAAITIPSPRTGTVVELNGEVGDTVFVGNVITVIDDGAGGSNNDTAERAKQKKSTAPAASPEDKDVAGGNGSRTAMAAPPSPAPSWGRVIAAPATRRLARELNIDIKRVPPTGPAGRVTPEDVKAFADGGGKTETGSVPTPAGGKEPAARSELKEPAAPAPGAGGIPLLDLEPLPDFQRWGPVETEPLRSIRRKVARKMTTSMILVPHVAHMDEVDVTLLEELRRQQKERLADQPGGKLTLLAFAVKAVTGALKTAPAFNASLDPFNEQIIYKKYYNIGVAVDTGRGLIVPVIRDTDRKSILEISADIEQAAEKARSGELPVEDLRGGTFTITNIGPLGGTGMIPTINYPESAILAMGRAKDQPVVVDGQITVRKIMPITLAFDHRIADGADAARFVNEIMRRLSDPNALLIET